jgi:hypothetical protein
MRRREFLGVLAGAATASPDSVRAQQTGLPVVAYIRSGTAAAEPDYVPAFRNGLNEAGMPKAGTLRSNTIGWTVTMSACRH